MKDRTKKTSDVESTTSCPHIAEPVKSPPEQRVAKSELYSADTDIGLEISDILDALPFYVLLVDDHHNILQANSAVQVHLGLKPEDIIGKYCPKVIHGLDESFDGCPLEEAVETGQAVEREVFDSKTGRWVRSAIYPTKRLTADGSRILFHMVADITEHKQAEEQLKASHERLRSLSAHLESAREEERKRIARDLHDETSQVLASLTAHLEAAAGMLPTGANKTKAMLRKAESLSITILEALHKLIYELRPTLLDDLGLVAATRWLAENNLEAEGIKVSLEIGGRERRLPPQLETTLFRVIQEAVYNIARHAHARNASLSLHFRKSFIRVHIKDDGKGFDVEEAISSKDRPRGLGLLGMKERIELINGVFDIQSYPGGGGTEISVEIPLNRKVSSQ